MSRPDAVTAKNSDAKFAPHPDGQFPGQCVDVIDMGETVADFPGTPKYLSPKCVLVFRTGEKNPETGDLIDVSGEYTVSMSEKANLRKLLESWRGKPYTMEQADAGVPIDKLVGQWALLGVAHKQSKKGRTYAVIMSATPVPAVMKASLGSFPTYERAPYWADRKKAYAEEARNFRATEGAAPAEAEGDAGDGYADSTDDDLPF